MKAVVRKPQTVAASKGASLKRFIPIFYGLAIMLVVMVAYIPALQSGFIWDDDVMLTENPAIKSKGGLQSIWFTTELSDYFPLTSTMFWIEWRLWGLNPLGYNMVNVLLHGLGAVLFWRVLKRLAVPGAWGAALIFALHPVCVASVAWVAERKNTLSLVFFLAALSLYLRFERQGARRWYWLSFAAFLLALLSKTSVVMLPVVLLLLAWWQRGRVGKNDLLRSLPFFIASLLLGMVTVWFQTGRAPLWAQEQGDDLLTRILGGTWATWFYLSKAVFPVKLSMIYPKWDINTGAFWSYLPGLIWLMGVITCWRCRHRGGRALLFGLGFFWINLLPVFGFFEMSFLLHSRVADHWNYLSLMGVVALAVGCVVFLAKRLNPVRWQRWSGTALCCVAIAFGVQTWRQSAVYRDEETLWRATLEKNPNAWVAHVKLGDEMVKREQFEEAAEHYLKALQINPAYPKAYNNRANVLSLLGDTEKAIEHYFHALRLHPNYSDAHNNLGLHLLQLGEIEEAAAHFLEAIKYKPGYAVAHFNAGNAFLKLGEYALAEKHFAETVRLKPHIGEAYYNLAMVQAVQGKRAQAIYNLRETLRLKPGDAEALFELEQLTGSE